MADSERSWVTWRVQASSQLHGSMKHTPEGFVFVKSDKSHADVLRIHQEVKRRCKLSLGTSLDYPHSQRLYKQERAEELAKVMIELGFEGVAIVEEFVRETRKEVT